MASTKFTHPCSHWVPLIWMAPRGKGTRVTTVTHSTEYFPSQEAMLTASLRVALARLKAQPKMKLRSP